MTSNALVRLPRMWLVLLCLTVSAGPLFAATKSAPAATKPAPAAAANPLSEAQSLYDQSKFDAAIARLKTAISSGQVTGTETIAARALMGRCLVKAGKRLEAKEAFKSLLREDSGFRLDPATVPPDEMDVFALASREITAEQVELGRRVPASIGLIYGWSGDANHHIAQSLGPDFSKHFTNDAEFGGSVRFPLRPRLSLDIQLTHLGATNQNHVAYDSLKTSLKIASLPLIASLYYTLLPREKYRVSGFVGAGAMLSTSYRDDFFLNLPGASIPLGISDERVGLIAQAGLEGEYLLTHKLSLSGRVLGRSADTSKMFSTGFFSKAALSDFTVSFSGLSAAVALRAYIGY